MSNSQKLTSYVNPFVGTKNMGHTFPGATAPFGTVSYTHLDVYKRQSVTTPATPAYAGAPVPSINTATGEVTLPPNTPAGSYAITYQICDKSGSPCDPATVTVTVDATVCAGNTTQLTGSGTPASTNPWVSSNTSIATVSNTGLVTACLLYTSRCV